MRGAVFAKAADQRADQQRLPQRERNAVDRKRDADHRRIPAKAGLAVIGPDRRVDVHRDAKEQEGRQQAPKARQAGDGTKRAKRVGARKAEGASGGVCHRLGQDEPAEGQVGQRQACSGIERRTRVDRRQKPADQRPEDKAHAEACADQAKAPAALVGRA